MIENAPHKARFLHAISAYAGLRGKYFEKYVLCLLTKIVGGKVAMRCFYPIIKALSFVPVRPAAELG